MESELYNVGTSEGYINALDKLHYYKSIGANIEIKQVKLTRSSSQNRALHLYFTFCANALNDAGFEFSYRGIKGMEIQIPWNADLFKNMIWRQIQITLFDFESTTKLTTTEINTILDVLTNHFSKLGIDVQFPNNFEYWLNKVYKP